MSDIADAYGKVGAYLDTINRIEPDIAMIDTGAALASIAISLRRIADALEGTNEHGGLVSISRDIRDYTNRPPR